MNNYHQVKQLLDSGVCSHNHEICLYFMFDTAMSGPVQFTDHLYHYTSSGVFELTQKARSGVYVIKIRFPKAVNASRMPSLNYTVADVAQLSNALTQALQRCKVK